MFHPSTLAYESWGRIPKALPARVVAVAPTGEIPASAEAPMLAYGKGRSYGDACLNGSGTLLTTDELDRTLVFDIENGIIRAEAGMTLAGVLARIVPHGWFLPVTPGTQFVTLGGAVANDVHGKNHHVAGTFGRFVTALELVRSTGERLKLTPDGEHADLFRATVSGLGLTGLITWVEFRLLRIESDTIDQASTKFASLDAFFEVNELANARSPYVVSWLDTLRPEGRGLLIEGDHATGPGARLPVPGAAASPRLSVPMDAPSWALNPLTVRAFNTVYYHKQRQLVARSRTHYRPFFYPLDAISQWNRGYGKRGFYQYQFVVPFEDSKDAVREVLDRLARAGAGSFLAVLKTFGDLPSPGLMSFPRPGVTLALDLPNRGHDTVRLLHSCDAIVCEAGGAVYPAKDACMTPESFRAAFPQWETFSAFIDPAFSSSFWRRVTR
ncbi:MAG: FAD-binding oxidoreductase [Rubricoccaceae bacterium]